MGSYFVPEEEVGRLVNEFDQLFVQSMIATGQLKRNHYAVVVCEFSEGEELFAQLFIPDGVSPDDDFLGNARGKVRVCLESDMDSGVVVQLAPEMLQAGHFRHPGGVIFGRWVIAISGFTAYDDTVLSQMLGWYMRRYAYACLAKVPEGVNFIG